MKNKYILFDFDGVIVDSFKPAFEVNKKMCPIMTEDDYRKRFEGNINDWKETDSKHDDRCRHDIDFFEEYIPKMKSQITVVNGMKNVIHDLSKQYSLIIISSTTTAPIQEFLERNNLAKFFTEIMGNDLHTSKIKKMKLVFSKYKTSPDNCIFVTDTLGDIREAKKSNVVAIGVSWGFHTKETLNKDKPLKIVDEPKELLTVINKYFL